MADPDQTRRETASDSVQNNNHQYSWEPVSVPNHIAFSPLRDCGDHKISFPKGTFTRIHKPGQMWQIPQDMTVNVSVVGSDETE